MTKPTATAILAEKGRKKFLFAALAALLIAGAAAALFTGLLPGLAKSGAAHSQENTERELKHVAAKAEKSTPIFLDLPDIIVNLNAGQRHAVFLKLHAQLELSQAQDKAVIEAAMPRVLDLFQGFLREMRPDELRGTAGTYKLREELLARTNLAVLPAQVNTVLFTQMLIQ